MQTTYLLIGIFARTMAVWWIVNSWARNRYREDVRIADCSESSLDATSDQQASTISSADRSTRRDAQRNGPVRYSLRWLLGSVAVLVSAVDGFTVFRTAQETATTPIIVFAIFVTAGVLMQAEMAASNLWKRICFTGGWLMATAISLAVPSIRYSGGENLAEAIVTIVCYHPAIWMMLLATLFLAFPVAEWIGAFMARWASDVNLGAGLDDAGLWIGRIERTLILFFVVSETPSGIAVLLTATSAFRFSEWRLGKDTDVSRKMIEYILIGSMLSYGSALIIGWLVASLLKIMPPVFPH